MSQAQDEERAEIFKKIDNHLVAICRLAVEMKDPVVMRFAANLMELIKKFEEEVQS